MIDLAECKKGFHPWENIIETGGFMDTFNERVYWCPVCGAVRQYQTMDGKKIGVNSVYLIPKAAKKLDKNQKNLT